MAEPVQQLNEPTAHYSVITAILVLCSLVVVSGIYVTLPLGSPLADAFQTSPARAAWASSAFTSAYALGFLLFAPLSERLGRWPVMFWGLLALGLITPLLGLAQDLQVLIVLRAVQGLAAATFAPTVMIYITESFPPQRRVAAMGLVSTGFLVSAIAGQLFSSAVSGYWDWRYVFYIHGSLCLAAALLTGVFVPRGTAVPTRASLAALYRQLPAQFLNKRLVLCYLICLTVLLSFVGMYTIFQEDLTKPPFALTAAQLMQVRAAGLAGMILSPFAGRLAARFGFKRMLQAGLLLAAAGLAAAGLSRTLPLLVGMSIVYIAGISLLIPVLISLIGLLAGEQRGPAITVYSLMLFTGASAGPQAALSLMRAGGSLSAFEGLAALLLAAFGISCIIRMPEL